MVGRKVLALATLLLVTQGCVATSGGPKRVALIVGNSAYKYVTELKNPANDASAMSQSLQRLGWHVTVGVDETALDLHKKIEGFSKLLVGADAAVFFYAGHAIQLDGENFLMPVDGDLGEKEDVSGELVSLNAVLTKLGQARTSVVFLDACRTNPWAEEVKKKIESGRAVTAKKGSGVKVVGTGLAKVSSQVGTLIAFATSPGKVASDGTGEHSPFTAGLLKHIEEPGLEVTDLLRKVRASVQAETGGAQLPWDTSALVEALYFRTKRVKRPPPP